MTIPGAGVARGLKMKTGFNSAEVFRKYLWFLLRERKFDTEAVNDMVQLKASLQLSDEEVLGSNTHYHTHFHMHKLMLI